MLKKIFENYGAVSKLGEIYLKNSALRRRGKHPVLDIYRGKLAKNSPYLMSDFCQGFSSKSA